ncbi:MAG: DUF932 domain-containing protein [Isosphaera sp.]|nr:DUF932 domain-containing protein [Isosphaera sp.]
MAKAHLTGARDELFRRAPDERFPDLQALGDHCLKDKSESRDRWHPPRSLAPDPDDARLRLAVGTDGAFEMNDWSFGQLCHLAKVSKETVNRLTPGTAAAVFRETLPAGTKPLQVLTRGDAVRSVHAASYTRLYNADLVAVLREFAVDFRPPQPGLDGGTGLYCGEQDMFCFLIDPAGWAEIDGEAFAPGFFLWNSEVGKRSVGLQTFWWQAVCQNHIVWDAVEVEEFARKHTANVHDAVAEIRRRIEALVARRDARRDGFAAVIRKAMQTTLGADADETLKQLGKAGFTRALANEAIEIARQQGRFTIFALVDALTRLAGRIANAGDRAEADAKAARLLALAA